MLQFMNFKPLDDQNITSDDQLKIMGKTVSKKDNSDLITAIVYLFTQVIIGAIILMVACAIIAMKYDIDMQTVINSFNEYTSTGVGTKDDALVATLQLFYVNLISLILCVFFLRYYICKDLLLFKKNTKKMTVLILISFVVFYILATSVETLVGMVTNQNDSTNQKMIEDIIKYYPVYGFISVVILAPVVEELIFRKLIFNVLKKKKDYVPLIISTLIFALMHMVGDNGDILNTLLITITYLVPSVLLGLLYIISEKNIMVNIIMHSLLNLTSFIFLMLSL